jgi:hypothetical protein
VVAVSLIFYGNTASGGGQGQSSRPGTVIKIRNIYLNHEFTENFSLRSGVLPIVSDPRSFIFNDHVPNKTIILNEKKIAA